MSKLTKFLLLFAVVWLTISNTTANRWADNKINHMLDKLDKRNGKMLISDLDNLRWMFVMARQFSMSMAKNNKGEMFRKTRELGKMQRVYKRSFPCTNLTLARSPEPPDSVNRLRPGDIDVIASFGDSLSAGNGVLSGNLLEVLNEFRGITFAGGGMGDWRTFLTLPNILKMFNPNLYGYSTDGGLTLDRSSRLNIAEPMLMSRDMPFQARLFIQRMLHDPNIDMLRHWKLLTIFVGNNDICSDMCHYNDSVTFLRNHENDLRSTFTILRDNVPRLLVNLVPVPNMVTTIHPMRNLPLVCHAVHLVGCHCVFSQRIIGDKLQAASEQINRFQQIEKYVAALPEFNTDDFAVVYQPFTANVTTPSLPNGDPDLRYFASDCFHFSQLGHAAMANTLWNNMLQPIGHKELDMRPAFSRFECPTEKRPYIATLQNS